MCVRYSKLSKCSVLTGGLSSSLILVGIMVMFLQIPGPYITKVLIDDVYPHKDDTLLTFILILGAVLSTAGLGFTGSIKHLFWPLCGCQHGTGF